MTDAGVVEYAERLSDLLFGYAEVSVADDRLLFGLATDSREVQSGYGFLACRGSRVHGQEYIDSAVQRGATAIIVDASDQDSVQSQVKYEATDIPVYAVANLNRKVGIIAARFYGFPSQKMHVVAVTGTNGKTSCTHFLAQCFYALQQPTGVIGTVGAGVWGALSDSTHTTPPPINLQSMLAQLRSQSIQHVFVEASSHGIEQDRLLGTQVKIAVFTNFSRDHLDYHGTVQRYADAKAKLFDFENLQYAVLNLDDNHVQQMMHGIPEPVKKIVFGLNRHPAFDKTPYLFATINTIGLEGLTLTVESSWGQADISLGLLGRFNASNVLAVLATLLHLEVSFARAVACVVGLVSPVGRMERFGGGAGSPLVVVDYAHTPDALEQVLATLRDHCSQHLWVVFGCGGDRDVGKRSLMGAIAQQLADFVVITNDNPRHENPDAIIADIVTGFSAAGSDKIKIIRDRAMAIAYAIRHAEAADLVLIAGKGHEDHQIVGDKRLSFSDRNFVKQLMSKVA